MAEKITLEEALELVDFQKDRGKWYAAVVKGYCDIVGGNCRIVQGDCHIVEGDCHIVEGTVRKTINGRKWRYVETPNGRLKRLIKEGADKDKLLEALDQLEDSNG